MNNEYAAKVLAVLLSEYEPPNFTLEREALTLAIAALRPKQAENAEFEVMCNDELVAGASGSREEAWREVMHYAGQYAADGEIEIYEVTRRQVKL